MEGVMAWGARDVGESRIEFVIRASSGKETIATLCREFEISRDTGYRWLKRYQKRGRIVDVTELSRKPHHSPGKTAKALERRVVALRCKYGWGARKLEVLLQRENLTLPVSTINRIIKRNNLLCEEDCHTPALKRFERKNPNELWQTDFKGPMRYLDGTCTPLSMIDDCSRFIVGLHPLEKTTTEVVQDCFRATFEAFGLPRAILFDHGAPWWGTAHECGLTRLSVWLMNQDIELIFGAYRHPHTQGKVERFHRTLEETVRHKGKPEKWDDWRPLLKEVVHEYNNIRPHESLGMAVPASRYKKSSREFRTEPESWEYPSKIGSVLKLDSLGRVMYRGMRFFISEALAYQYVQFIELEYSTLVAYRHMYVREVNPRTGAAAPVLAPARLQQLSGMS